MVRVLVHPLPPPSTSAPSSSCLSASGGSVELFLAFSAALAPVLGLALDHALSEQPRPQPSPQRRFAAVAGALAALTCAVTEKGDSRGAYEAIVGWFVVLALERAWEARARAVVLERERAPNLGNECLMADSDCCRLALQPFAADSTTASALCSHPRHLHACRTSSLFFQTFLYSSSGVGRAGVLEAVGSAGGDARIAFLRRRARYAENCIGTSSFSRSVGLWAAHHVARTLVERLRCFWSTPGTDCAARAPFYHVKLQSARVGARAGCFPSGDAAAAANSDWQRQAWGGIAGGRSLGRGGAPAPDCLRAGHLR